MAEYIVMGHMELANILSRGPTYYLSYHAVFKAESVTTKLRVMFDGSATTSSGLSLNDILLKGPKAQPDLICILLRFRIHRIAITAGGRSQNVQTSAGCRRGPRLSAHFVPSRPT
jgi:hypothetical protein